MHISTADVIARLQAGETVLHRGHGHSMTGAIDDGAVQTLEPVTDPSTIKVGDAVFCKVRGSVFTHEVEAIAKEGKKLKFKITRIWPTRRSNGWTYQKNIYGRVIAVNGQPYKTNR